MADGTVLHCSTFTNEPTGARLRITRPVRILQPERTSDTHCLLLNSIFTRRLKCYYINSTRYCRIILSQCSSKSISLGIQEILYFLLLKYRIANMQWGKKKNVYMYSGVSQYVWWMCLYRTHPDTQATKG